MRDNLLLLRLLVVGLYSQISLCFLALYSSVMVLATNKAKAIALMYMQVRVYAYRLYICMDVCVSMHMYIQTNVYVEVCGQG